MHEGVWALSENTDRQTFQQAALFPTAKPQVSHVTSILLIREFKRVLNDKEFFFASFSVLLH